MKVNKMKKVALFLLKIKRLSIYERNLHKAKENIYKYLL